MAMTSYERFLRMYQHREADRIPMVDSPWEGTLRRWRRDGMPEDADWRDFFGMDKWELISTDNSPRYEEKVLEDAPGYTIKTSSWGVTMKHFKEEDSTPAFLDYKVHDPASWEDAKARMLKGEGRIDWKHLEKHYPLWRAEGRWVSALFWFGFDVAHSWMAGTENILIAMAEEPEWVEDVFETFLQTTMHLFQQIWDAGYRFDEIFWYDDMGYKNTTFFSNRMYRQLLKPYHRRAVEWAHEKGIYAHLHSCGDVMTRVPDLVDIGVDCLNPLEIKAGMDPLALKAEYGDRLTLHGGINAVLWEDREKVTSEIARLVPQLKERGGYIFSSDHSIPNSVSLENFREIIRAVKRYGTY
ncbi:MAG: uroporphyrinogen decarboxylase family protein [Christensenellales bacterium]|jgi:uroporphyrinogen decarboxylase